RTLRHTDESALYRTRTIVPNNREHIIGESRGALGQVKRRIAQSDATADDELIVFSHAGGARGIDVEDGTALQHQIRRNHLPVDRGTDVIARSNRAAEAADGSGQSLTVQFAARIDFHRAALESIDVKVAGVHYHFAGAIVVSCEHQMAASD